MSDFWHVDLRAAVGHLSGVTWSVNTENIGLEANDTDLRVAHIEVEVKVNISLSKNM